MNYFLIYKIKFILLIIYINRGVRCKRGSLRPRRNKGSILLLELGKEDKQPSGIGCIASWARGIEIIKDRDLSNLWRFMDCYPKVEKTSGKAEKRGRKGA